MISYRSTFGRVAASAFVLSVVVCTVFRPTAGHADGAIAVALPQDVVKSGFAYGYVTDAADSNHADADALGKCRETTINAIRPLCEVVQDFKNQCVAVAMDPQAGTPGVGWGVANTLKDAQAQAMSKCQNTAGPGRRAACVVDHSACDGTAK